MRVEWRTEAKTVILVPEPGDDPTDLEDEIDDAVRAGAEDGGKPAMRTVILDLTGTRDQARWLKVVGPEIPDVTLRIALGPKGYAVASLLGLVAIVEWYPTVEAALLGGK